MRIDAELTPIDENELEYNYRDCFGEPFVSTTLVLCRIRYYFVAVKGLGSHIHGRRFVSLLCYCARPLPGPAMRIDVELTPIDENELEYNCTRVVLNI